MGAAIEPRTRPEAMADVPGVCELTLTRAVVQYRDRHELDLPGGRIEDIGVGLVLEGEYAASCEAIDLGSGAVKHLDLGSELVILDWVYEPTIQYIRSLLSVAPTSHLAGAGEVRGPLGQYCLGLGLSVLSRLGFTAITRPTLLRIGFRDVCRDLDLHEATAVRVVVDREHLVRAHLDYDANALIFDAGCGRPQADLEETLLAAFPGRDIRRGGLELPALEPRCRYQVRFPLPLSLGETIAEMDEIRSGFSRLYLRFERDRYRAMRRVIDTFGVRRTLAQLHVREPLSEPMPLLEPYWPGSARIH